MGFGSDRLLPGYLPSNPEQAGIRLKSVLIVDGEADIRALLKRGLEKEFSLVETVGILWPPERRFTRALPFPI